ncbi:MAG TPA: hypothetical protein VG406_02225 [Isosphaeraceae bacterium]|jgi:hypothetical protein|nr:hypothetical protein [Isosphaeraceae bacterium]
MRRIHVLAATLLLLPLPAVACLWDYDTLASEAKGLPDVVRVITGRFERNPPLYYEMRLARVAKRIEEEPGDLAAYDDAGVACDRLGRDDEAIAWMEKKRARLDHLDPSAEEAREHRYRYLANLGTFHAHRWFRAGADRSKPDDMKTGRDLIAEAIRLKPDAHFGREKYQLMAMEWILDDSKEKHDVFYNPMDKSTPPAEAVKGLTGLIVLGNAWESIDVFNSLTMAFVADRVRTSMAEFSKLRAEELASQGHTSLVRRDPAFGDTAYVRYHEGYLPYPEVVEAAFLRLRREADTWHLKRTAYMMARLKEGRHPDTDPTFWKDFQDDGPPGLPDAQSMQAKIRTYYYPEPSWEAWAVIGLAWVGAGALAWNGFVLTRRLVRTVRARKARRADDRLA